MTGAQKDVVRLLRDQMKERGSTQDHLDAITVLIAQCFAAEVCSIYVLRDGLDATDSGAEQTRLELVATTGLNPGAVHQTTLRMGEGIVGLVAGQATALAVSDAPNHPNFAFRPETGEDPYQSMLGVPLLRDGGVLGVVAVQNRAHRAYGEEEIESLETVAMVLSELLASSDHTPSDDPVAPDRLAGLCLVAGLAVAPAVMHNRNLVIARRACDDPDAEVGRLFKALTVMRESIDDMLARTEITALGEQREVLESYRMFATDRGWIGRIVECIRAEKLSAEYAVQTSQDKIRKRMGAVADPYLRERLADFEDLSNRLLGHLQGASDQDRALPAEFVVVARTMGPAELLDYKGKKLRAVVLEEGSPTAHVTLVARTLDIPVLGQCRGCLTHVREGDLLVVDATHDQLLIRPAASVAQSCRESMKGRRQRQVEISAGRALPACTRDGCAVSLNCNAGLLVDLPNVLNSGAEGIGLYRTEVPFMVRQSLPGVGAQADLYRRIYNGVEGRRVVFRTLDVGGDKVLPYWAMAAEENPAIGWRALRIGLDRPALLRQQLRALIRASAGRELSVMFPLVTDLREYHAARDLLDIELRREQSRGAPPPATLRVGAVLEVPSLVWSLPELCPHIDFLSVGTNDLLQFFFAADRGNRHLSGRYDSLALPAVRMLRQIAQVCRDHGVEVTVCGDMAAQPLDAFALLCAGYRSLSVPPPQIAPLRRMVRALDVGAATAFFDDLLSRGVADLRADLKRHADHLGLDLGNA